MYRLARQQRVIMTVYDAVGREVMRPVDDLQDVGIQQVPVDLSGLSSGMYIIRVQTEGGVFSHKALLVR